MKAVKWVLLLIGICYGLYTVAVCLQALTEWYFRL